MSSHLRRGFFAVASAVVISCLPAHPAISAEGDTAAQTTAQAADQTTGQATDQTTNQLAEIVVTAEKRAEPLGHVPISISAYDTKEMDLRGIADLTDIAQVTPGLIYTENGAFNNISIRGITSTSTAGASLVAIYVDDVPVQVRTGLGAFRTDIPQIFDLDRVEVLRGPQGTLFGASAMGGVIRFIDRDPSLTDYSGYARSEIAQTDGGALSDEAGVAYGGPIIDDKLGFRVYAWDQTDGGYINHFSYIPGGAHETDANSTDRYAARGALAYAPNDAVRVTAAVFTQEVVNNDLGKFYPDVSDPSDNDFVETDLLLNPINDKYTIPSLKIDATLGWADFTSNTGYLHRLFQQYVDYTTVIPAALGEPLPTTSNEYQQLGEFTTQNTFVQELRLTSPSVLTQWNWVAGLYFSDARQNGVENIAAPTFPGALVNGLYSYDAGEDFNDKSVAAYGNLEYSITRQLSVSAGVRVSRLTGNYFSQGAGPLFGPARTVTGYTTDTPVTPKFGINYKPNSQNLIYVSAAKGFREGGSNAPITIPNAACEDQLEALHLTSNPGYNPDSLWSYELGSKNELLGGSLVIDASVFHITWHDIQRTVQIPVCTAGLTLNLGDGISNGFDLALQSQLTDHLTVSLDMGYTSAETAHTVTFVGVQYAAEGEQISDEPPWTVTAAIQYNLDHAYFRIENRYLSKNNGNFSFLNPANTGSYNATEGIDDSVEDLILRAGLTWGGFDLSMFVNNATNQHPLLGLVTTRASSAYGAETIRPLTVGLTGIYHW